MEFVRHYVHDSGNSSLRGFFSSEAVDFDPPSNSLRANVRKANCRSIYNLADGSTDDDDEVEIRDRMVYSHNSYELVRMMQVMDNWEGLDDELEEGQVDDVAKQLVVVLEQRDFVPYQLARRYLAILDYATSPTLGSSLSQLLRWPEPWRSVEIDTLLGVGRGALLKSITSATMRGRDGSVNAAHIDPGVIGAFGAAPLAKGAEIVGLMHEVIYTSNICSGLRKLDYTPLYLIVADMVDGSKPPVQRIACRDTCLRLGPEFSAAARAVNTMGSSEAKATVNRFMATLKAATDNFSPTLPAPSAIDPILAALGALAGTLADLITAITNLPDAFTTLTLSDLLDETGDDDARALVNELNSQSTLAHLGFSLKLTLLNAIIDGWTDDDDETAINHILRAAHDYDIGEVYQLVTGVSWEALDSCMNGDEYDTMEGILNDLK